MILFIPKGKKKVNGPGFPAALLFVTLWFLTFSAAPTSAITTDAESVVVIHTEGGSGYGVAWGGAGRIVTALHLVGGKQKIQINSGTKKTTGRIEKIYQEADLALLKMDTDLKIPQLELYPGNPPWGTNLNYWEKPTARSKMGGKTTALQKKTQLNNLNARLLNGKLGEALCSMNGNPYPALTTNVFKFEEPNIKKAHSGTPLTYNNKIIGLVDGGDNVNGGKSCVWAIPATEFENLRDQGTNVFTGFQTCQSEKLYSGLRSDNPFLTPAEIEVAKVIEASNANPVKASNEKGDELVFTHNFTAPIEAIYDEMFPEDQEKIDQLLENNGLEFSQLFSEWISFYQEENTGVTIALPEKSNFRAYPYNEGFRIGIDIFREGVGGVFVYGLVLKTNEPATRKRYEIRDVKQELLSARRNWEQKPGKEDVVLDLLEGNAPEPYYSELIEREAKDESGMLESEIYASITVNDLDVIAMSVVLDNQENSAGDKEAKKKFFVLMQACTILTDFAYY